MAVFAGKQALAEKNRAVVLSHRFDKEDRGKAADLTEEEAFFSSKDGRYGWYGESAREMNEDLGNRQIAVAENMIIRDMVDQFPLLKNSFGLLAVVYPSNNDLVEKSPAFGPALGSKRSFKEVTVGLKRSLNVAERKKISHGLGTGPHESRASEQAIGPKSGPNYS